MEIVHEGNDLVYSGSEGENLGLEETVEEGDPEDGNEAAVMTMAVKELGVAL